MHRAFSGISLFSFAMEQTIGIINIFIQHYGVGTTLAKKISASLEALQLEIGFYWQPTWGKLLWPAFSGNTVLDKVPLGKTTLLSLQDIPILSNPTSPKRIWFLTIPLFWMAGYRGAQLQALNRCRLALTLIFLSDIATACGQFLEKRLILDPILPDGKVLQFTFPNKQPSRTNWKLWLEFWSAFSGPGGSFLIPLGE